MDEEKPIKQQSPTNQPTLSNYFNDQLRANTSVVPQFTRNSVSSNSNPWCYCKRPSVLCHSKQPQSFGHAFYGCVTKQCQYFDWAPNYNKSPQQMQSTDPVITFGNGDNVTVRRQERSSNDLILEQLSTMQSTINGMSQRLDKLADTLGNYTHLLATWTKEADRKLDKLVDTCD